MQLSISTEDSKFTALGIFGNTKPILIQYPTKGYKKWLIIMRYNDKDTPKVAKITADKDGPVTVFDFRSSQ
jgi:hypothetical protein